MPDEPRYLVTYNYVSVEKSPSLVKICKDFNDDHQTYTREEITERCITHGFSARVFTRKANYVAHISPLGHWTAA